MDHSILTSAASYLVEEPLLLFFQPMTCFWWHDVFLTSWCTFWRYDELFDIMTNLLTLWRTFWRIFDVIAASWRCDELFDVIICFWCHDELFSSCRIVFDVMCFWHTDKLFGVMTCFWHILTKLTCFWLFDVRTYFLSNDELFNVMTYFMNSWRVFDVMTKLLTS